MILIYKIQVLFCVISHPRGAGKCQLVHKLKFWLTDLFSPDFDPSVVPPGGRTPRPPGVPCPPTPGTLQRRNQEGKHFFSYLPSGRAEPRA